MDVSSSKLGFYSRPARKFWTFLTDFSDVKTSVWALTETLPIAASTIDWTTPLLKDKTRPGIFVICLTVASWQKNYRDIMSIHFDTRLDKMDFSAAINKLSFKRYLTI